MSSKADIQVIHSGVANLDAILHGGVPKGSFTIFAGAPGAGKTILSQQIAFHNAAPDCRVLMCQTLSEPTAKTLKYCKRFNFFDQDKLDKSMIEFVDLGAMIRSKGLEHGIAMLMENVKRVQPSIVVIDSFKVFADLAASREDLRKFTYEVAVNLMAWEITSFLLGEFNQLDIETNPLFSIADGIIKMSAFEESGEQRRYLQIIKMRGTDHRREPYSLSISGDGVKVYAPNLVLRRETTKDLYTTSGSPKRTATGIVDVDRMLGEGIPVGSSLLISGGPGSGKTLLALEFICRGASELGQKGIFISFEETEDRLRANARGMGWNLDEQIEKGNVEILFIPPTDISLEKDLLQILDRVTKLKARRVVLDSMSLFLHKIEDRSKVREKVFQLATIIQRAQAVGFFTSDVPAGSRRISRFGVEETIVDGVILLSSQYIGSERQRHLEVYKLRNTAHSEGVHPMKITSKGITLPKSKK